MIVSKQNFQCYYCENPAIHFYRTQEDYEKKYHLTKSHLLFTCEDHILNGSTPESLSGDGFVEFMNDLHYIEISLEEVMVFHVMSE